jgi:hypothetical protein
MLALVVVSKGVDVPLFTVTPSQTELQSVVMVPAAALTVSCPLVHPAVLPAGSLNLYVFPPDVQVAVVPPVAAIAVEKPLFVPKFVTYILLFVSPNVPVLV